MDPISGPAEREKPVLFVCACQQCPALLWIVYHGFGGVTGSGGTTCWGVFTTGFGTPPVRPGLSPVWGGGSPPVPGGSPWVLGHHGLGGHPRVLGVPPRVAPGFPGGSFTRSSALGRFGRIRVLS